MIFQSRPKNLTIVHLARSFTLAEDLEATGLPGNTP